MSARLRIGVIRGSARESGFGDTIARWVEREMAADSAFEVTRIDQRAAVSNESPALQRSIDRTDGFVVVTPEYNHGYPASLKAVIDAAYEEWFAKPVAFVSYGGISGGVRAVEQLRQVFAALHCVTLRDTVMFVNAWERFDTAGELIEPDSYEPALQHMLERLAWWARALRSAREIHPYGLAVAEA